MTKKLINEEDILTRVHKYELSNENSRFFIDVHEVLMGSYENKFAAIPNLLLRSAPEEYFGVGKTEQEALDDCLQKVKNVSTDILFPELE